MKKPTEKQPIDELFARKLGNMSLPPSPNGFERLQARMGQHEPQDKVVFWRNPDLQRYMAAAACLLLVCLFGWLYWPTGRTILLNQQSIAANPSVKSPLKNSTQHQTEPSSEKNASEVSMPDRPDEKAVAEQVAVGAKATESQDEKNDAINQAIATRRVNNPAMSERNESTIAQAMPVKKPDAPETTILENQPASKQPEQVADNKPATRPTQASERVLDVTIAEPEALVAARQVATESVQEKPVLVATEKQPKEAKGFWQQVRRIKQGEVFARHDNPANDERGLLGRAYSGLKQSFDKDKSAKQ